jgi:hypothetical protein
MQPYFIHQIYEFFIRHTVFVFNWFRCDELMVQGVTFSAIERAAVRFAFMSSKGEVRAVAKRGSGTPMMEGVMGTSQL